jgi:sporulation protein YlmC with PRC-barrel domain
MNEIRETPDPRSERESPDPSANRSSLAIHLGAPVETSDGVGIGRVDRVVIDPVEKTVTDLIVHQSTLFSRDVVIPVGGIELADEAGVRVIFTIDDLERLPDFVETAYVPLESQDHAPLITWEDGSADDGRAVLVPAASLYQPEVMPFAPRLVEEQRNTAASGTIDIVIGTVVEDGEEEIGRVDEVSVDVETGRLLGVVVEGIDGRNFLDPSDFQIVPGEPIRLRLRPAVEPVADQAIEEVSDEAERSSS